MGKSGSRIPASVSPSVGGYYGKVPVVGDFVARGWPRGIEDAIDPWLRASMRASQTALGRGWLDAFLVTPVWHFALPPGIVGTGSLLGVMMPSVDRVGRYFPLVIGAAIPAPLLPALKSVEHLRLFDAAEALALSTLSPGFSMADFDAGIAALPLPDGDDLTALVNDGAPLPSDSADKTVWWTGTRAAHWVTGLPEPEAFAETFMVPVEAEGSTPPDPAPLHEPTPALEPEVANPIPAPPSQAPAAAPVLRAEPDPPQPETTPRSPLMTLDVAEARMKGLRSNALSDITISATDGQAFTLMSGLGQDPALPAALSSVAPMLADIAHPFAMNDLVAEAKGKLGRANATLCARAVGSGQTCAASTVTLLIQAHRHAVLWAGSAQAFLLRDGALEPLTRPHLDPRLRNIVTRALGAGPNLTLDTAIGQVCPGDRFVLVSPGLYDALGPHEIGEALSGAPDAATAVAHLSQNALIAGASLDASALAVFANARTANDF